VRTLPLLVALALALVPWLAAAERDDDGEHGEGESPSRRAAAAASDPAGDEASSLSLPSDGPWNALLPCHDPSIDILDVTASATRRALQVEVRHAAPVLAPQLKCAGAPVAVASQRHSLVVGGADNTSLLLDVDGGGACLYVLFADPPQMSDCLPGGRAEGASIHLAAGLQGNVSVGEGAFRQYRLAGTLAIHAAAQERAAARPGPGLPFVPTTLLQVEDHGEGALLLALRR
jgi:hypothetical protein